jgi:hypothetical protein
MTVPHFFRFPDAAAGQRLPGRTSRTFVFSVIAAHPGGEPWDVADAIAERLYAANCDDATASYQNGVWVIDFDRAAPNLTHAAVSALHDVSRAGLSALRVEPDELVSAAEIARRLEVSRQAVSKWFQADPGDAPVPAYGASSDSPLYDWLEVLRWLRRRGSRRAARFDVVQARLMKEVNEAWAAQRAAPGHRGAAESGA